MSRGYIELDRKFAELTEVDLNNETDVFQNYLRMNEKYSWDELLEKFNYIVILGEAGSGKTKELEYRCKILCEKKEYAFFTKIESLADEYNFSNTLRTTEEHELFENWLKGDKSGYFFLDSVDEAKLREKSFEQALRHLSISLKSQNLTRAKIIISCRVSDWKSKFDKETFEEYILPKKEIERKVSEDDQTFNFERGPNYTAPTIKIIDKSVLNIFSLIPLNKKQIKMFAYFLGIGEYEKFTKVIEENDYWHLCDRPQDVEWLVRYWDSNKKLDCYLKLIQHNVEKKLEEFNNNLRIGNLNIEKLLKGAENLAAATILCKKSAISLSDEYLQTLKLDKSLNPEEILKDWKPIDIENLLRRGIFDEATYGRVQFHHRAVVEYLTARWFNRVISKNINRDKIERILFSNIYDIKVIKESLRPILAWLALMDTKIHNRLVKEYPEILISFGDPSSISLDIRKKILINFCHKYKDYQRTDIWFEEISIRRFASKNLDVLVHNLLKKYDNVYHIKILLLRIVSEGKYKKCKDILFKIARNENENSAVRYWSLIAIVNINDSNIIRETKDYFLRNAVNLPHDIGGSFLELFYPYHLDKKEFIAFLKGTEENWNDSWSSVPRKIKDIALYDFPIEKYEDFLLGLVFVVQEKITSIKNNNSTNLHNYRKLFETISELTIKILTINKKDNINIDVITEALIILGIGKKYLGIYDQEVFKIIKLVSSFPKIKQKAFYNKLDRLKQQKNDIKYYYELNYLYYEFWRFDENDCPAPYSGTNA